MDTMARKQTQIVVTEIRARDRNLPRTKTMPHGQLHLAWRTGVNAHIALGANKIEHGPEPIALHCIVNSKRTPHSPKRRTQGLDVFSDTTRVIDVQRGTVTRRQLGQ